MNDHFCVVGREFGANVKLECLRDPVYRALVIEILKALEAKKTNLAESESENQSRASVRRLGGQS